MAKTRVHISTVVSVEGHGDILSAIRALQAEIQKQFDARVIHDWVVEVLPAGKAA